MGSRAWLGGGRLGAHPGSLPVESCGVLLTELVGRRRDGLA